MSFLVEFAIFYKLSFFFIVCSNDAQICILGKHYGKAVDWMDATGRELSLWQNMLERPNFWVEGAVTLRPNLHNHGKNNSS